MNYPLSKDVSRYGTRSPHSHDWPTKTPYHLRLVFAKPVVAVSRGLEAESGLEEDLAIGGWSAAARGRETSRGACAAGLCSAAKTESAIG